VIIALLTSKPNDIIIIENPEAHLHPKGQSKLAELMCLVAQNGVQIFCETHSDHVFNGVRLAVKKFHKGEKGIDKDNAQCFYFRKKGFESEVIPIEIDTNGQINKRPTGLFDEWGNILDQLTD
jgi:predicted ATPase